MDGDGAFPHSSTATEIDPQKKIAALESHVKQLKNIIAKLHCDEDSKKLLSSRQKERKFDFTLHKSRHVAFWILYLGWDYQGFSVQEETEKTIESAIFNALLKVKLIPNRESSNYHRCGRTDRGVSAFMQVISIDVRSSSSVQDVDDSSDSELPYLTMLNRVLPREIRVVAWSPVVPDFSARFDCSQRMYKYFFPAKGLNLDAMRGAALRLVGCHDFRNFCRMDVANGVTNFQREITSVDIDFNGERDVQACISISGKAFLWHQIRCIMTVLFLVGKGLEDEEVIDKFLDIEQNPRKPNYTLAADYPLCLFEAKFQKDRSPHWHRDSTETVKVLSHLQQMHLVYSIKARMVKEMMTSLEATLPPDQLSSVPLPVTHLEPGKTPRDYVPLLSRQKGRTLEEKLETTFKRKKLATSVENRQAPSDRLSTSTL